MKSYILKDGKYYKIKRRLASGKISVRNLQTLQTEELENIDLEFITILKVPVIFL